MASDDFLKECLSDVGGNVPLDQFNQAFCRVCGNRDCARSGLNNSTFDVRVRGWRKTLFTDVPRAADGDPRYDPIRAKRFSPLASRAYEVRSIDEVPAPVRPGSEAVPAPTEAPRRAPPGPAPVPEPVPAPRPAPPAAGMENTPFSQGLIVPGGERVQEPGSTFTFDSDD